MLEPNKCTQFLSEKEILQDGLISQKHITESYNTFAGECVNDQLRSTFLNILDDEHKIQANMFCTMQTNGSYQVENAPQQKVDAARQKFSAQP